MIDYVEAAGQTVLCDVMTGENCIDRELAYIEKFKPKTREEQQSQFDRLQKLVSEDSLERELNYWAIRRMRILKWLLAIPREDLADEEPDAKADEEKETEEEGEDNTKSEL